MPPPSHIPPEDRSPLDNPRVKLRSARATYRANAMIALLYLARLGPDLVAGCSPLAGDAL